MGGTNPDTLSGATITVSQEPAKWSHAPLVVSRTFSIDRSRYETLPTGLSFNPLGFPLCPEAHVGRAGCTTRIQDTNPTTGQQPPAASIGQPHRVHSVKTAGRVRRDYYKSISAILRCRIQHELQHRYRFYYDCRMFAIVKLKFHVNENFSASRCCTLTAVLKFISLSEFH